MTNAYYAGQDIDAPCGRCKGETRHRIKSITDGVPEQLICMNCNSIHKFRLEKPSPSPASPRASRVPSVTARTSTPSPSRFQELMIEEQAGTRCKTYSIRERWEEGSWMDHPVFGLGKVQKRQGKKVDVLFRTGLKTLISG
jgi:hypothetical protein